MATFAFADLPRWARAVAFAATASEEIPALRRAKCRDSCRASIDMEDSAVAVLKRAVELDSASRFQESLICYQEGIDLLLSVLKGESFVFPTPEPGGELASAVPHFADLNKSEKKNFACLVHSQRWIAYGRGNPNCKGSLSLNGEDLHFICSPCLVFKSLQDLMQKMYFHHLWNWA